MSIFDSTEGLSSYRSNHLFIHPSIDLSSTIIDDRKRSSFNERPGALYRKSQQNQNRIDEQDSSRKETESASPSVKSESDVF